MDFVERCRSFIAIESTPTQGCRGAALFFAELCRTHGLTVELQSEVHLDREEFNVIARPQNERPAEELLLQNHLDTVDPGPYALWQRTGQNPFDAHIIENKIYGLGTAEVKLDLLCKLQAVVELAKKGALWKIPPVLVATFGEETGMAGALKLIRKNRISAKKAFVGEASNLRLITAGKGMVTVEIRLPFESDERQFRIDHRFNESTATQNKIFNGKPVHSSTPQLGESAIEKMFEYLAKLPEDISLIEVDGGVSFNTVPSHAFLEFDLTSGNRFPMARKLMIIHRCLMGLDSEFHLHEDPDFVPSRPTLTVGTIRSTDDAVVITGNCRISPKISETVYNTWMNKIDQSCKNVGGSFHITDFKKAYRTELSSEFTKGCQDELRAMGLNPEPTTQSSINEASLFSRVGIECLSFGPGRRDGNLHTPEEHVSLNDLNLAIEFYKRVITRFCL